MSDILIIIPLRRYIMKIYVEKVRLEKRLTLAELSRLSGVATSHIYNIEAGNKIPTLTVLCKLAAALEVPAAELFSCSDKE